MIGFNIRYIQEWKKKGSRTFQYGACLFTVELCILWVREMPLVNVHRYGIVPTPELKGSDYALTKGLKLDNSQVEPAV
jgi:hypothetical protein